MWTPSSEAVLSSLLSFSLFFPAKPSPLSPSSPFPTVDLGYARHIPTYTNTSSSTNVTWAAYRNIRFAHPPLGDNRFRAPVTPPPVAEGIQDGRLPRNSTNCVQTWPRWYSTPPGFNGTTWGSEDCLFLDVFVPEGLGEAAAAGTTGVPVLHWLYGGGFFSGAKDWGGDPASLFEDMHPDGKFIIVASNYRLSSLGWMSSETEGDMTANAGLYDAWAALQWTKNYLYLFGGDPEQVTVMGQSAGGGIIQHFLAADANGRDIPFSQAVLSSPGYRPHVDRAAELTGIYDMFLNVTGCEDVGCLRGLPTEDIIKANEYMMLKVPAGAFGGPSIGFGPVIDGDLVRDVPDRVLADRNSSKSGGRVKRVITGGMQNEGVANEGVTWGEFLTIFARTPSEQTVQTVERLYGQYNNESAFAPDGTPTPTVLDKFYGDIIYNCHSYFAAQHYSSPSPPSCSRTKPASYRYKMSIPPATHGLDIGYYFYSEAVAHLAPETVRPVAKTFQAYLRRFVRGEDMEGWPEEGEGWMEVMREGWVRKGRRGEKEEREREKCEGIVGLFRRGKDGW